MAIICDAFVAGNPSSNPGPNCRRLIVLQSHAVIGLGLRLDLLEARAGPKLDQRHPAAPPALDIEHAEIGNDHVDHAGAGQRQRALVQELRIDAAVLGLGRVRHDHYDLLDARDQVHGAAHALHHLAGDHPVCEVAVLGHLHGAEQRDVDVAAADHREAVGRGEEARGWKLGDGLLAGVDEVGIFFALVGERPEAKHAVLALQLHAHAFGNVVRHQRRDADAEIDVEAVAQLLRRAFRHLLTGPGHGFLLNGYFLGSRDDAFAYGALLDMFYGIGHVNDPLHEHARRDDVVGIDLARLNQDFHFGHRRLGRGRHHRVEIARGLSIDEVALGIALPGVHDRQIGDDAALHDVALAVEFALFLALGDVGAGAGAREESGNAGAAGADALGKGALRIEFDFQLAGQELRREGLVLADVGRDHFLDLLGLQQ